MINQKLSPKANLPRMEKLRKILIATGIFYPDIGGPASYASALAGRLSSDSVKVNVLTYSGVWRHKEDHSANFKIVRVWRALPKFLRHFIFFIQCLRLVPGSGVVLSLNAVSAGLPALTAARIFRKKFWVRIVGDYAWEMAVNKGKTPFLIDDFQKISRSGKRTGFLHKVQRLVCQRADGIIVPSNYLAEIVAGWGVKSSKIRVVYNGSDFQKSVLNKESARKKIGIHGNIILTVGRLVPWKGFKMLIKIMPKLLEINHFGRLVIVGDGPERRLLEQMVKNMNLHNKVFLVGKKNREDLAVYFAASDMFVLNTGYEGFSHQLLEAMIAGIPIVTTAVGGNREIIKQGENGFLVRYNDEFNLIEAIKTIWQEKDLADFFARAGSESVQSFSIQKMLDETTKILEGA